MTVEDDLARHLGEFARELQAQDDAAGVLATVVRSALLLVGGADEGSISVVVGRKRVRSEAASSELPRILDSLQEEVGQGPCLDAVFEHRTVRVPDMASEARWPDFTRRACAHGAASMMSLQLFVQGDNLGALNLYGRRSGAFDATSERVGLLVASHAAVAFAAVQRHAALERALASREVVGQAEGILMERHRVTAEEAFAVLVRSSQERNLKLHEVARRLVETGVLPLGA